jgi:hypothetical protein
VLTLANRGQLLRNSIIVDVDFWTWAALIAHKHVFVGIENWKNRPCGLN